MVNIPDHRSHIPFNPIIRANQFAILVIEPNEQYTQKIARLLTLAGMRAIVTRTLYHGFERFLQERFIPQLILLGKTEDINSPLFTRFYQRLQQETLRETPILSITKLPPTDGLILKADALLSTTQHSIVETGRRFLDIIWQKLPTARVPLEITQNTMVIHELPKSGFRPRISNTKHYTALHFLHQLKAAKNVIPEEQWINLLGDVGLTQFSNENLWSDIDPATVIPPEYTTCLNRAVQFSNPNYAAQQAYHWANQVEAEVLDKQILVFIVQQIPKLVGPDFSLRGLLTGVSNEVNRIRGEKITEWKRLDNGSFMFVFYSTLFIYGFIGAEQPSCYVWQASFDKMLQLSDLQHSWSVHEIECSAQTLTGHCVFHFVSKKSSL